MLSPLWAPLPAPRPRRQGGWRQRIANEAMDADGGPPPTISRLFGNHMLSWCEGVISAQRLQFLAASGVADGFRHPMLTRLASIQQGQHAQASLVELLETCGVPQMISHFPGEFVSHGLLPSTWLKVLHTFPHEFRMRLGADRAKLRTFWQQFLSRPCNHDVRDSHPVVGGMGPDELETVIPFTLHADAGPYSKTSACYCVSCSSLVGIGEAKLTKFLCASYVQRAGGTDDSLWWGHLLDDLLALGSGVVNGRAIARDPDGTVWRVALLFVKCDEDVRANDFGLAHFAARHEVCPECLANRTTRPFTDMSAGASWRAGEDMDFTVYKARARDPHHPVVASAFFCHRFFFPIDQMHLLECKGVTPVVFGSVLVWLLLDARLGANKEARLAVINARREEFYTDNPGAHRLPKIYMGNCTRDGWGNLSGPAYKAAKIRGAAPFFRSLVHSYCTSARPQDREMRNVVAALDDLYNELYAAPMFPSDATVARVRKICLDFGAAYQRMRELSRRAGKYAFPVTPKTHKVQHLPKLTTCINPVRVQVYAEESLMGSTTSTWRGSKSGRYKHVVQRIVLVKQFVAMLLRFELAL